MIEILELKNRKDIFDEAVDFFWQKWGNQRKLRFLSGLYEAFL